MQNLQNLSNEALLSSIKKSVASEREMTLSVLKHIREIDRRRLFASLAFSSLFDYVTRELGYDSASAMRRIEAARLLKDIPEVEEKIEMGRLSLSVAARAQNFFKKEQTAPEKKKEIIQALENKSTRESEKILSQLSQNPNFQFHERIRPVSAELSEVLFFADDSFLDKMEQLKGLLAHSYPKMSTAELMAYLVELGLKKLDPSILKTSKKTDIGSAQNPTLDQTQDEQSSESTISNPKTSPTNRSRRPPSTTIRAIWKRDGGRCVWKNSETGKNCGSQYRIQIDHKIPWALGGNHSTSNLRCLCFYHNQLESEKWFGARTR